MPDAQSLLIRLVAHPLNNPHLIDKLIVVKGLPCEWVFKKAKFHIENYDGTIEDGVGNELLRPWEEDVDVNIPHEVRERTEPIVYVRWFPDVRHQDRTYKGFWDKRMCWGLKLDYGFGPAQDLWNRIEDFIDKTLARGEKMPEAVQVAKDQKSEFRTYLAKRGKNLSSLEMVEMDVPIVDLRVPVIIPNTTTAETITPVVFKTVVTVPVDPAPPETVKEEKAEENLFRCDECKKEFKNQHGFKIHVARAHSREIVKA